MKTGKVPENVLKRSVLRQLKTEGNEILNGAGIGEDCAIFSFDDRFLVSCMQEAALKVKSGSAAVSPVPGPLFTVTQLMQKCANNLAVSGARPAASLIALLMPETTEEAELKALMDEAAQICGQLSMPIAGGQTRVLQEISVPIAVVTGFGKLPPKGPPRKGAPRTAAAGQDVVISKWIGLEGTALLADRYRESLLSRYPAHLVEEAAGFDRYLSVLPEAATAMESGVCAMHDASEGGVFAALWELAEKAGVGLTIDMKKIPLRQETVEVCEFCGVNPYELLSGGSLIMTTEDGPGLADALQDRHIPAAIIGKVTDENARVLINGDEVRYMDRPKGDEVYRAFNRPDQ